MKLAVRPLKYLRFLGWCVLGNAQNLQWQKVVNAGKGTLEWVSVEEMDSPDFLEKHNRTYRYGKAEGAWSRFRIISVFNWLVLEDVNLKTKVDEEVVKQRTEHSRSALCTREVEFSRSLKRRDGHCVFTGATDVLEGMYVIPFARGDEVGLSDLGACSFFFLFMSMLVVVENHCKNPEKYDQRRREHQETHEH
jgi:hypothetical protein